MEPVVSCGQARELDKLTRETARLSGLQLMEIASLRLWDEAAKLLQAGKPRSDASLGEEAEGRSAPEAFGGLLRRCREAGKSASIVAVCGKGDNAGDALAMLRHARSAGFVNVNVVLLFDGFSDSADKNFKSAAALGARVFRWSEAGGAEARKIIAEADLILDGITGTGAKGALRGTAADAVYFLNSLRPVEKRPLIAAVDIPSGLSDEWEDGFAVLEADATLALHPMKEALFDWKTRLYSGAIFPVGGVFPQEIVDKVSSGCLLSERDIDNLNVPIPATSYKKTRGRLAIFAGSRGSAGAAILCAKAALASGAGYVALFCDGDLVDPLSQALPSIMVRPFPASPFEPESWDCALAGPGWGRGKDRLDALSRLLSCGIPLLLDADAIRLYATLPPRPAAGPLVMTPHPGELGPLLETMGIEARGLSTAQALSVAERTGATVVLKAHTTSIVSASGEKAFWDGMCPALGTAGSGDVLAGLIAGIYSGAIARGGGENEGLAFESCELGVIVHGSAGRRLARERGWFSSVELIPECAKILGKDLEKSLRP